MTVQGRELPSALAAALARLARSRRNRISPTSPGTGDDLLATPADLLACYRLLLGRQPDEGGLAHYTDRIAAGISASELVEEFLGSVEFARRPSGRRPGARATELVTTCEGFRMHVDPSDFAVGHTLARTGSYEPDVSATLRRVLRPGQTFLDIGANLGWFSLLGASLVGRHGRVVAIEPNPFNVALLRQSVEENAMQGVEVLAVALGDKAGAMALETDGSNGRVVPIDGPLLEPVQASFVVAVHPLDSLVEKLGVDHVDVVKMDVEGAEPLVLRGAMRTFGRDRPVLISEFFPLALDSAPWGDAKGYLCSLRDLGYDLSVIGHEEVHDDDGILALATAPGHDHVDLIATSSPLTC